MKGTGTTVAQQNWVLTCVPVQVKLMHYVARVSAMDGHYTCIMFSSCSGSKNTDGVAVACMCHNMSLLINTNPSLLPCPHLYFILLAYTAFPYTIYCCTYLLYLPCLHIDHVSCMYNMETMAAST